MTRELLRRCFDELCAPGSYAVPVDEALLSDLQSELMKRACARCEYFDGGGELRVREAIEGLRILQGDCLNRAAASFQTDSHSSCAMFTEAA